MMRHVVLLAALLSLSMSVVAQTVAVEQVWHSATAKSVTINVKAAPNSAVATVPISIQRFNEFDLKVGDTETKELSLTPTNVSTVTLDESELKGAAYVTYSVTLPGGPTVAQRADVRSAQKTVEESAQIRDQLEQAQRDIAAAKRAQAAEISKKQADNEALKRQLASLDKESVKSFLPTSISLDGPPEVFDDRIGFYVRTNKPGLVEVIALQDTDGGAEISTKKSERPATEHLIQLDERLAPGSTYRYEVQVLNFDGTRRADATKLTFRDTPLLRQTMVPKLASPRPDVGNIVASPFAIEVPVGVERDSVVSIQLSAKRGRNWIPVDTRGSAPALKKTEFGRPEHPNYEYQRAGETKVYTFDSLDPDKEYRVDVTAVASDGAVDTWSSEGRETIKTPPRVPDLQFKDGLTIEFSASELKLIWESNVEPDAATIDIVVPGANLQLGNPTVTREGTKITATVKSPVLSTLAAFGTQPTLVARMTKNQKDAEMRVRVTLRLPDAAAIAALPDNATRTAVQDLMSVVQRKGERKRFDWNGLIRTGLGLVLAGL